MSYMPLKHRSTWKHFKINANKEAQKQNNYTIVRDEEKGETFTSKGLGGGLLGLPTPKHTTLRGLGGSERVWRRQRRGWKKW